MPNRYVREDAIESERVNALSWQAEVFFRRLINRVDDFGRFTASVPLLRASIFPLQLAKVSDKDVAKLVAECEQCGLLATYEADGKRFLALAKWEQGRAKGSKYPPPPDDIRERLQTYVYKRGHSPANAPDSDSDSDTHSDTDTDTDMKDSRRFAPPVREELDLHAAKIGLPAVEVDKFVAFYVSKNWMVGKTKMKSWHGAMTGWKLRWEERNGQHGHTGSGSNRPLTASEQRNATLGDGDLERIQANSDRRARELAEWMAANPDRTPFDGDR
jgi:hypothetical protein